MGDNQNQPFQFSFNPSLKVGFQGSRVTSDGGLILVRELDDRLGFGDLIAQHLTDPRRGKNTQLPLVDLLRQSFYSRIAGYQDVNGAERLSQDPTFRLIGSEKICAPTPGPHAGGAVVSAPVLTAVTSTRVAGAACGGCTVEICSDKAEQSATYERAVQADAHCAFMFEKTGGCAGRACRRSLPLLQGMSKFSTCVPAASPVRLTVPASRGAGSIDVTAPASCRYDVATGETWIKLPSGSPAARNSRVNSTSDANNARRTRTGAIVIDGQVVAVVQARP